MPAAASGNAGLYLHVPFCSAICPYCDFAVLTGKPAVREAFADSLCAEIGLWSDWSVPIDSVYFGGGTPSLLGTDALGRIIETLRTRLPIERGSKWFIEVNPEDVDVERARSWQTLGFTHVSLGVQSFVATELRRLGRRHDREQGRRAVEICLDSGFDTVSIDLMFGLPDQTAAAWRESLDLAIALGPQHISCYQLTVHEGTTFARWRNRGKLTEMPEAEQAELYALTHRRLSAAGWVAYEVSNFAMSAEHQSRHNKKYWRHAPYLGLGPSAHSFDGGRRWWNERGLSSYRSRISEGDKPIADGETLSREELALEALMLGLRTTEGINVDAFSHQYGIDLVEVNAALIDTLVAEGLVKVRDGRLCPTLAGLAVADGLAVRCQFE